MERCMNEAYQLQAETERRMLIEEFTTKLMCHDKLKVMGCSEQTENIHHNGSNSTHTFWEK
jgi:hypothetical protein